MTEITGNRGRGRPKGSKNKATKSLESTMARLKCDPAAALARMVNNKQLDPVLRKDAAKALMPYLYNQRKAVEISGTDGDPFVFQFVRLGEHD